MQQVRLAEPDAAVDEERVVGAAGVSGHRLRRRVREPVAGTDHEGVEGVVRRQNHLVIEARERIAGHRVPGGLRHTSLPLLGAVAADKAHGEEPASRGLCGLGEWLDAASLQVAETNRLGHKQPQHATLDLERLDLVEPVAADVGVMSAEIGVQRVLEFRVDMRHGPVPSDVRTRAHRASDDPHSPLGRARQN